VPGWRIQARQRPHATWTPCPAQRSEEEHKARTEVARCWDCLHFGLISVCCISLLAHMHALAGAVCSGICSLMENAQQHLSSLGFRQEHESDPASSVPRLAAAAASVACAGHRALCTCRTRSLRAPRARWTGRTAWTACTAGAPGARSGDAGLCCGTTPAAPTASTLRGGQRSSSCGQARGWRARKTELAKL